MVWVYRISVFNGRGWCFTGEPYVTQSGAQREADRLARLNPKATFQVTRRKAGYLSHFVQQVA